MKLLDSGDPAFRRHWEALLQQRSSSMQEVLEVVRGVLQDVRERGDEALVRLTERFDGVKLRVEELEVKRQRWREAMALVDGEVLEALEAAASNIEAFHKQQLREGWVDLSPGVVRGELSRPVERAGIYVPGGKALYPSSLLMGVIPARVAGVEEVVVVTPPSAGGVNPVVLAAAEIAGADRLFQVGGAQALAALAYGTRTVPRVDVIAGPGNLYVTAAKRLLYGEVGVDMLAGPSELLILSDGSSSPRFAAADLLSQAEHDQEAWTLLITPERAFAHRVIEELEAILAETPRREVASESLRRHGFVVVVKDLQEGMELVNEFAPEHLELHLKEPLSWLERVKNAGVVFLGDQTPVALGDYYAGPNHILPTARAARYSSPLGVWTFLKRINFLYYDRGALAEAAKRVVPLARVEGLEAHAEAVKVRVEDE